MRCEPGSGRIIGPPWKTWGDMVLFFLGGIVEDGL